MKKAVATFKTEAEVFEAIRLRFPSPAWELFAGVANGTGSRARRWADGIAIGVWPSRGLEILGFEIKVSRSDWRRELEQPEKSDEVARYCDRWWVAVGSKDIVRESEVPPNWGLLVPRGKALVVAKEAPKLEAKPVDRGFIAAILRRAAERFDEPRIVQRVRAEMARGVREEVEENHRSALEFERQQAQAARDELAKVNGQLRSAYDGGYGPDMIGKAIDLLVKLRAWDAGIEQLEGTATSLDRDAARLEKLAGNLRGAAELCKLLEVKG